MFDRLLDRRLGGCRAATSLLVRSLNLIVECLSERILYPRIPGNTCYRGLNLSEIGSFLMDARVNVGLVRAEFSGGFFPLINGRMKFSNE